MTSADTTTRWARTLIDELARAGLRHVTLAPGSRSTPLVLAFHQHPDTELHVHLDERSAAFHALGTGKTTATPAATVTTSGTAAANLYPALIEARYSNAPLLLLTADRPPKKHGADANQTIDQTNLYADNALDRHDLGPPSSEPDALRHLRSQTNRLFAQAQGPPGGPVHINCPFPKPLEPPQPARQTAPSTLHARADQAPYTQTHNHPRQLPPGHVEDLAQRLDHAQRPLLIAGATRNPLATGPLLTQLAHTTQTPLLADALSGARFAPQAEDTALTAYDLFLRNEHLQEDLRPDLILRFGSTPTSQITRRWLTTNADTPQIIIDDKERWNDAPDAAHAYHHADPAHAAKQLSQAASTTSPQAWTQAWHDAQAQTEGILEDEHALDPFEATVLGYAVNALPPGGQLVAGNSMPIRDLDAYTTPRNDPLHVIANRGASGIDGLVSTAIGAASATGKPTLAVLGDLTLLHDANGLHALAQEDAPLVILTINNDGGGIFHKLPVRDHDGFDRYFATPHGRRLEPLAEHHKIPYDRLTLDDVFTPLQEALEEGGPTLLEVPSDRSHNQKRHEAVEKRVMSTLQTEQR